ncbi:hypothetical protein [Lutibacter sp. B1]|uniref:hypothetical protein n=1 Tax=Lutibacter sp. B1 TaxID=2725996 RepID=UPI001456EAB2|nr:hypothetical protein [Lutibacter sp. B1]NLP58943.1 hypothetical protein [Lutibacter sp. B1]
MKTIKSYISNLLFVVLAIFLTFSSCDDDLPNYPFIASIPCDNPDVVADPNIINDFECQNNVVLSGVEQVLNPDESGINTSRFVGKYTDPTAPWDALIIDYGAPIDLSIYNTFKIKIKTNITGVLIVKLEGGTSPAKELSKNITSSNWTEYTFDFSDQFNQSHNKLVMFFNAGVDTDGTDEYYIDDLRFVTTTDPCVGVVADFSIVNDFDCQQNQEVPEVELVATPSKSDVNSSKFAGKYIDELGAWDAVIIDYGEAIDLSTNNVFKIKVLAPVTGTLKAKLEGGTSSAIEKDAVISKTGEWVEYSYDFSSEASENHTKIVLFFNAGVDTEGTDVYYIDDLRFREASDPCADVITDLSIINDFDCQINSTIPGYLANTIIENPDKSDINSSDFVLEVTDNGTDAWDALIFDYGGALDLSTKNYLKIKILSDKAVPLLAKLEGGTSGAKEVWGEIDTVGEWKEYIFDFSDQTAENHQKVVFFFNGGKDDGTTSDIYYIDDIRFTEYDPCDGVATDLSVVNDFECQQNYEITCCIDTVIIDNPDGSGINTSSKVLEVTDNGTEAWDALVFDFGGAIDLSTKNQLKIKVLSSRAVPLLAKLEGGSIAAKEVWGAIDTANAWTEYTFDFSSEASGDHQKIVFFFNGGENDGTATDIYYIDDIKWE